MDDRDYLELKSKYDLLQRDADLLKGELTQEVLELRDSNYRGYKGSFDYKYIGNGNVQKKNENMAKFFTKKTKFKQK